MNKILNTKRNIIWGMTNQFIALGFPFIIRTVILRTLGAEYLGLNSLFTSIIQVLNLAELGFSSAIVYSLYKPIAEENVDEIRAILCFFRKVYKIIGCGIFVVGMILCPFLPHLIKGTPPDDVNIYILYIMYLVNTSVSYILFSYEECILLAHQRNDLSSKRNIIIKFMLYTLQIITLLSVKSYYLYVLMLPLTTIINDIIIHVVVKKNYPQYYACGDLNDTVKMKIKEQVSGLMIIKIAALTRNSFDNIIMSSFIGLTIVGFYGNYYYIMSSVQTVMLILLSSIQAAIGNNIATKSVEVNYREFRMISFGYVWLASWATICMIVFYQPFITLWVGKESLLPYAMVYLMALYFYFLTMGDVPNLYIDGTGIWWHFNLKSIVEAVSNLFLNIVLVKCFGIFGIVIATIITRFLFGIVWGNALLFRYYFGKNKIKSYYTDYIQYFCVVFLSAFLIHVINKILAVPQNTLSIIHVIECILIPNSMFLIFYYKTKRYAYLKEILNKLIRK